MHFLRLPYTKYGYALYAGQEHGTTLNVFIHKVHKLTSTWLAEHQPNHMHSSPIWEIIIIVVLSNDKIVRGEVEYDLHHCVYKYFQNWTSMCVIAY